MSYGRTVVCVFALSLSTQLIAHPPTSENPQEGFLLAVLSKTIATAFIWMAVRSIAATREK